MHCNLFISTENLSKTSGFRLLFWQICDFSLSKWKQYSQSHTSSRSKRGGTVTHTPPEIWQDITQRRTVKCDVYSFGILFWELITEETAFKHGSILTIAMKIWKRIHFMYKSSVRKNVTNPPEFVHTWQGLYVCTSVNICIFVTNIN